MHVAESRFCMFPTRYVLNSIKTSVVSNFSLYLFLYFIHLGGGCKVRQVVFGLVHPIDGQREVLVRLSFGLQTMFIIFLPLSPVAFIIYKLVMVLLSPGQTETLFGQALRWLAMTCAHFGRDQIFTQVKASSSPFGHPNQVNASWMLSIDLLLANEIKDSLIKIFFFGDLRVLVSPFGHLTKMKTKMLMTNHCVVVRTFLVVSLTGCSTTGAVTTGWLSWWFAMIIWASAKALFCSSQACFVFFSVALPAATR